MQLILSWATVVISTLYAASYLSDDDSTDGEDNQPGDAWLIVSDSRTISALGDAAFFLTVVASFLISFDSYINAKVRAKFEQSLCQTTMFTGCCIFLPRSPRLRHTSHLRSSRCRQARWRQLRSCAGSLESITWAYRTRVAPFDARDGNTELDAAERELRVALINWREEVAAGADLNTTTLRRHFPPQVFKHDQRPPPAESLMQRCWRALRDWLKRKNYIARNLVRARARRGTVGRC